MNIAIVTSVSFSKNSDRQRIAHSLYCFNKCIRSIENSIQYCTQSGEWNSSTFTIYIIDDYSTMSIENMLPTTELNIKVLANAGVKGQGGALNFALKSILADAFFITDSDCEVSNMWVFEGLSEASFSGHSLITGPNWLHIKGDDFITRYLTVNEERLIKYSASNYLNMDTTTWIDCRNLLIKKEFLLEVGADFFVTNTPSVSSHTSYKIASKRMEAKFSGRIEVFHQPISGVISLITKYYRRGNEGDFAQIYAMQHSSLVTAFFKKYLKRHFYLPIFKGRVSILFVLIAHSSFWIGIVSSKRK